MIQTVLEGLLPGMRTLRVPLISGLLWALLLWLFLAPIIPSPQDSHGFAKQLYAVASALGASPTLVVTTVLVFIVGATLATVTDALTTALGWAIQRLTHWFRWQRQIRIGVTDLDREIDGLQASLTRISEDQNAELSSRPDKRSQSLQRELDECLRQRAKVLPTRKKHSPRGTSSEHGTASSAPAAPRNTWWNRLGVKQTQAIRRILGAPPQADEALARMIADLARHDGENEEKARIAPPLSKEEINDAWQHMTSPNSDQERLFLQEAAEGDPLELLRAANSNLYAEMDRKRSERELRLAISPPLIILLISTGLSIGSWWVGAISIVPSLMMIRHSLSAAEERADILRLFQLHRLSTPSIEAIRMQGREDMRTAARIRDNRRDARQPQDQQEAPLILQPSVYLPTTTEDGSRPS